MTKKPPPGDVDKPNNVLTIEQNTGETRTQAMARKLLEPHLRHALSGSAYAGGLLGSDAERPDIMDFVDHVQNATDKAEGGDLAIASRLLAAQAITLDTMFTEFARRAAVNMGEYINAAERYGRLSFKAQSNCRATLEALAKLHQPREQTVRHVHVNGGGRAVIADQIHHHRGDAEIVESTKQSDATGAASECAALPSPHATRDGVPIPGCDRQAAMQDARRDESGSA